MTPQPNTNYVPRAAWELYQYYKKPIDDSIDATTGTEFIDGILVSISFLIGGDHFEQGREEFIEYLKTIQPFPETEMCAIKIKGGYMRLLHSDEKSAQKEIDQNSAYYKRKEASIVKVAIREVGGVE